MSKLESTYHTMPGSAGGMPPPPSSNANEKAGLSHSQSQCIFLNCYDPFKRLMLHSTTTSIKLHQPMRYKRRKVQLTCQSIHILCLSVTDKMFLCPDILILSVDAALANAAVGARFIVSI